jgi:hypothetical protein
MLKRQMYIHERGGEVPSQQIDRLGFIDFYSMITISLRPTSHRILPNTDLEHLYR